jgi:hypothetical protein
VYDKSSFCVILHTIKGSVIQDFSSPFFDFFDFFDFILSFSAVHTKGRRISVFRLLVV